jgi:hypothetical protein
MTEKQNLGQIQPRPEGGFLWVHGAAALVYPDRR